VTAAGNAPAIDVHNGVFTLGAEEDSEVSGEVGALVGFSMDLVLNPILDFVLIDPLIAALDSVDPSLTKQRTATPQTRAISGLAVTAISRDDVETLSAGFSGAFEGAAELSGAASVMRNRTGAFIADGVTVNADPAAGPEQSVLVAAGTDSHHMGIAGSAAAGFLAAGGAADLTFIDTQTKAFIGGTAQVSASKDVQVLATGMEDVLAIAGGASGSGLGIEGSLPVVSVNALTHAFIGSSATVSAGGNVLVQARDDTDTDIFSGAASLGVGIGLGTSMGATLVDKDTQAWIGAGATVNSGARFADTMEVAAGHLGLEFDPSSDVQPGAFGDVVDVGPDHGLENGDAVVYRNGGGENLGDLVDGGTYFVHVDEVNPSLISLHGTEFAGDTGDARRRGPGPVLGVYLHPRGERRGWLGRADRQPGGGVRRFGHRSIHRRRRRDQHR
jgi:hypothetical protein